MADSSHYEAREQIPKIEHKSYHHFCQNSNQDKQNKKHSIIVGRESISETWVSSIGVLNIKIE